MNPKEQVLHYVSRAEQLLRVVYPLSKEPKVLVDVCKELSKAFPFMVRITISLPEEQQKVIDDVEAILEKHAKSPVEFSRDKKFIICSDGYDLTQLTTEKITRYLNTIKQFVKNE